MRGSRFGGRAAAVVAALVGLVAAAPAVAGERGGPYGIDHVLVPEATALSWQPGERDELGKAPGALARLDEVIARDPAAARERAERGRWLAALGRSDEARAAFAASATAAGGAPWQEQLFVANVLEHEGERALAAEVFDRAVVAMRAAGIEARELESVIHHRVLFGPPMRLALQRAVVSKDAERVDALLARVWTVSPSLEFGDRLFATMARWFAARGRPDLAATWTARAEAARAGTYNAARLAFDARYTILSPLTAGALLGMLLAVALVGLRTARRPTTRRWYARLRWHDALTVAIPLALAAGAAIQLQQASARFDEVLASELVPRAVLEAVAADPDLDAADHIAPYALRELAWMADVDEPWLAALVLAGLLLVGLLVGARVPRVASAIERVVPGAAPALGPASGVVLGLAIAGVLVIAFGFDRPLDVSRASEFLGVRLDPSPHPSRAWAWAALIGAVALQAGAVAWSRRRAARAG